FIAQDADQPQPAEGLLVMSDTMRGAVLGSTQVMFDLVPEDGLDVTSATFQIAPDVEYVLVTGLQPGAEYRVVGAGGFAQTLTADAAGLILIGGAPPGTMRVSVNE
ncbi:MAG: hypothetical protein JXA10_01420, partial [Anaerolineae bacterium]|nr:hypothetical protein [Anaerolineae bacterium]